VPFSFLAEGGERGSQTFPTLSCDLAALEREGVVLEEMI
jgi:hypothetical protein